MRSFKKIKSKDTRAYAQNGQYLTTIEFGSS